MLQTLKNAWKIPELRRKLLFTLFILLIYRLGSVIPVPFIDVTTLANYFDSVLSSTILGLYNAMSGSAFSRATVLALGIQPYINASIIIQLLTVAIPALERLAKDGGEDGKKKIERITRYTTVGLGLLMGWAYYMMLRNYSSQISIIRGPPARAGHHSGVHRRLRSGHVAGRADHRVWYRQRHLHDSVCQHHFRSALHAV